MGNRVRKELEMLIKYVVQREQSEEFKMVNLFTEVKVFYDPMAPKKEFHINFEIHTEHNPPRKRSYDVDFIMKMNYQRMQEVNKRIIDEIERLADILPYTGY